MVLNCLINNLGEFRLQETQWHLPGWSWKSVEVNFRREVLVSFFSSEEVLRGYIGMFASLFSSLLQKL